MNRRQFFPSLLAAFIPGVIAQETEARPPLYVVETHPSLGSDVEVDDEALRAMVDEMHNGLQRCVITQGITIKEIKR